jgi:hypothetical protein
LCFLFLNRNILNVPLFVKIHPQIETLNNQDHTDGVIIAVEEKKETLFNSKTEICC